MDIKPKHDQLIPDTATAKPRQGHVIYASFGKVNADDKRVPLDVKPADAVFEDKNNTK